MSRRANVAPVIASMWPDPADNEADIAWVKDDYATIAPHSDEAPTSLVDCAGIDGGLTIKTTIASNGGCPTLST